MSEAIKSEEKTLSYHLIQKIKNSLVKQTIIDGAKGGGLIICSSNTLHPGVNPENCIAMFEAVK